MAEEEIGYDVAINVHKGQNGYGIYFAQTGEIIQVTKVDDGSEAKAAGVQVGDLLHSVQDLNKLLPHHDPGTEVVVGQHNYQESLELVRKMKYCRLTFRTRGF